MPASRTGLLDANVWLACVADSHLHHRKAVDWLDAQTEVSCLFCRVTRLAFLRHLTSSKILGEDVRSRVEACELYVRRPARVGSPDRLLPRAEWLGGEVP
jgi:predicted nucleic acid-binding protein